MVVKERSEYQIRDSGRNYLYWHQQSGADGFLRGLGRHLLHRTKKPYQGTGRKISELEKRLEEKNCPLAINCLGLFLLLSNTGKRRHTNQNDL